LPPEQIRAQGGATRSALSTNSSFPINPPYATGEMLFLFTDGVTEAQDAFARSTRCPVSHALAAPPLTAARARGVGTGPVHHQRRHSAGRGVLCARVLPADRAYQLGVIVGLVIRSTRSSCAPW